MLISYRYCGSSLSQSFDHGIREVKVLTLYDQSVSRTCAAIPAHPITCAWVYANACSFNLNSLPWYSTWIFLKLDKYVSGSFAGDLLGVRNCQVVREFIELFVSKSLSINLGINVILLREITEIAEVLPFTVPG